MLFKHIKVMKYIRHEVDTHIKHSALRTTVMDLLTKRLGVHGEIHSQPLNDHLFATAILRTARAYFERYEVRTNSNYAMADLEAL